MFAQHNPYLLTLSGYIDSTSGFIFEDLGVYTRSDESVKDRQVVLSIWAPSVRSLYMSKLGLGIIILFSDELCVELDVGIECFIDARSLVLFRLVLA